PRNPATVAVWTAPGRSCPRVSPAQAHSRPPLSRVVVRESCGEAVSSTASSSGASTGWDSRPTTSASAGIAAMFTAAARAYAAHSARWTERIDGTAQGKEAPTTGTRPMTIGDGHVWVTSGHVSVTMPGRRTICHGSPHLGPRPGGSHLLRRVHSEGVETLDEDPLGELRERQAPGPHLLVGLLEDRGGLVEGRERLREGEQVGAQPVRLELGAHAHQRRPELEQLQRERALG